MLAHCSFLIWSLILVTQGIWNIASWCFFLCTSFTLMYHCINEFIQIFDKSKRNTMNHEEHYHQYNNYNIPYVASVFIFRTMYPPLFNFGKMVSNLLVPSHRTAWLKEHIGTDAPPSSTPPIGCSVSPISNTSAGSSSQPGSGEVSEKGGGAGDVSAPRYDGTNSTSCKIFGINHDNNYGNTLKNII